MRDKIPTEQLSEEQRTNLEYLAGVGAAFNAVLRERGLDLAVYRVQIGPLPDAPVARSDPRTEPIGPEPEPIGMPPPGGCYCTDCDDQGRCWGYCC